MLKIIIIIRIIIISLHIVQCSYYNVINISKYVSLHIPHSTQGHLSQFPRFLIILMNI
mgnify:CR=1 FL=1